MVYIAFGYDHWMVELSAYCGVGSEVLDFFFSKLLRLLEVDGVDLVYRTYLDDNLIIWLVLADYN